MKTFYSLIKISPNEVSGDNLTIGIVVSCSNVLRVAFSKSRKQIATSISGVNSSLINYVEREITNTVNKNNERLETEKGDLLNFPALLESEYFDYLSNYSNGLLKFSSPKMIATEINDSSFAKLFELLVDNSLVVDNLKIIEKDRDLRFYNMIEKKLISRVKSKVHTNIEINKSIVPTLFSPYTVDCIGMNGVLVGAKALPFSVTQDTILKSVNNYISIIAHLSSAKMKRLNDNKMFLIADEPKKNVPTHKVWKQLNEAEHLFKL
ncbi:MAG: hypothetical protein PF444_10235, partial [Bacteroidales bacterium]|nr:hypothetical protein [Bacteroidales bacterium]